MEEWMKRLLRFTGLFALVLAMLACSLPGIPGAGAQPTTIAALWPDVPQMDGTTKTDVQVPAFVSLLLTIVGKQALGSGQNAEWVDFTSTTKTPADVQAYYTIDLMSKNGWSASDQGQGACITGADQNVPQVGVFCIFSKDASGKTDGLMIVAVQDDKTKVTNIFYVRAQVETATPTPKK
jgi:hypothetical protein